MGRISKETMEKALEQLKTISEKDYAKVKDMVNVVRPFRSVRLSRSVRISRRCLYSRRMHTFGRT